MTHAAKPRVKLLLPSTTWAVTATVTFDLPPIDIAADLPRAVAELIKLVGAGALTPDEAALLAGLLDNRETESLSKLPFLGDLPLLGNLFKTRHEKRSRTDLVLIVTPEITQPLGPNDPRPQIAFPKDFLVRLSGEDVQAAKGAKAGGKKN